MSKPWSARPIWIPKRDWDKTVTGQMDHLGIQLHELAHAFLGLFPPLLRTRLEALHAGSFRHKGETARAKAARRWGGQP